MAILFFYYWWWWWHEKFHYHHHSRLCHHHKLYCRSWSSSVWSLPNEMVLHLLTFLITGFYTRETWYFINSQARVILPPTLSFLSSFLLPLLEREDRNFRYDIQLNAGSWFLILFHYCKCSVMLLLLHRLARVHVHVWKSSLIKCMYNLSLVLWILLVKYLLSVICVQFHFWHHNISLRLLCSLLTTYIHSDSMPNILHSAVRVNFL